MDILLDYNLKVVSSTQGVDTLPRLPFGFRSFLRPWWKTVWAIAKSRGLIFGGGTLFTDTESISACMMWWMYVATARLFSRPVFLAFQGVGPFRTRLGEWIARSVFSSAKFISVRDEQSLARVRLWHPSTAPVLTFDPAFVRFQQAEQRGLGKRVLALIPRHNSGEAFMRACQEVMTAGSWDTLRIILMDPNPTEFSIAESIRALPHLSSAEVVPAHSVTAFLASVSDATFIVAERFHGLLGATALHIPFRLVSTHQGDKFSTLARFSSGVPADTEDLVTLVKRGESALLLALKNYS